MLNTHGGTFWLMAEIWSALETAISDATGSRFRLEHRSPVGGGCINQTLLLEGAGERYIVKLNSADAHDMFDAEADGLEAIIASRTLRAPRPIARGISADQAWLVLEYLDLATPEAAADARLGELLAAMHTAPGTSFGWHRDNFIGRTPQPNRAADDWPSFFGKQRLGYQLELAGENGAAGQLLERGRALIDALPQFFTAYRPVPALLHGDLWSGNKGALASGEPVIFDPAVYRGDREAELAMTELFGGFDAAFYAAYRLHAPLDAGYAVRRDLYKLYHLLNHFNLFGGAYARQALAGVERLLSELR